MKVKEKSGAPGGTRTPDLLVRRGISHYTPTHAVQQEPIESARESNSFRLLLYPVVPRSRTNTRTILLLTLLLLFAGVASPQEQHRTFRIPFHSVNGLILLDAKVNGVPVVLLFDTGASRTVVSVASSPVPQY